MEKGIFSHEDAVKQALTEGKTLRGLLEDFSD